MMEVTEKPANWKEKVAGAVRYLGGFDQVPMPLKHYFAPGVYIREIFMPARTYVIGKIHKTEHFNVIIQGVVALIGENEPFKILEAPQTFVSKAGVQKALYIFEDTIWQTIHLTEERDLERLEAQLIEPDPSYPVLDRSEERAAIESAARSEPLRIGADI